jgi:rhodanese-related sulfurtransferase
MSAELKKSDPAKARQYFADKMAFSTGPVELARNLKEGADLVIVDVRAESDFATGHIPGAVNLPKERWQTQEGLRKDALNVVYCYSHVCHLAATAAVEFAGKGYPVMELDGGIKGWKDSELDIEKPTAGRQKQRAFST